MSFLAKFDKKSLNFEPGKPNGVLKIRYIEFSSIHVRLDLLQIKKWGRRSICCHIIPYISIYSVIFFLRNMTHTLKPAFSPQISK